LGSSDTKGNPIPSSFTLLLVALNLIFYYCYSFQDSIWMIRFCFLLTTFEVCSAEIVFTILFVFDIFAKGVEFIIFFIAIIFISV